MITKIKFLIILLLALPCSIMASKVAANEYTSNNIATANNTTVTANEHTSNNIATANNTTVTANKHTSNNIATANNTTVAANKYTSNNIATANNTTVAANEHTSNSITQRLSITRKNMAKLKTNLTANKKQAKTLLLELQQAEEKVSKAALELYQLTKTLKQNQANYQKLANKFVNLSNQYKTNQDILSQQIQLMYQIQHIPPAKLFFSEYNQADLNRILHYYRYIYNYQQQQLKNNTLILQQTKNLEQKMLTKITTIQNNKLAKAQQLATLKKANLVRNKLLANINANISKDHNLLTLLQRDEQALEVKIQQLQQANHNKQPLAMANNAIFAKLAPHQPIISTTTKIKMQEISTINPNRFIIHATPGDKVHAIQHGQIIFSGWLRGYGLLLIIKHNNNLLSLYGHTQAIFKKTGDQVVKGEVIALVGQSGGQAQPGLYFEIRQATTSINVRNWFNYETI